MHEVAEKSRGEPDARVKELLAWIRRHLLTGTAWNQRRLLVFTEYEDTLRYLHEQLTGQLADTDQAEERLALYRGSTPSEDRQSIQLAFNTDPDKHPLRILLANDAAREGLNLQAYCADLFHFDVPWNPARMEQRNGRIDRKLQTAPEVRCHYFLYEQRSEDRILAALVRKSETIKKELGSLNPIIEARLALPLADGLSRQKLHDIEQAIENTQAASPWQQVIDDELEATRDRQQDLAKQVQVLRELHHASSNWIDLEEASFRDAISTGLELMGAERLKPLTDGHYQFPALDKQEGHGARWTSSLDALRQPREREQSLWDWRREAPLRPVVFADPGKMTDEVAHLHLEHPVVRRILNHFIAQGFVHHDLARACITQTSDSLRRVLLIGRLCLFGSGASRLHEQLLVVSAIWQEPSLRKSKLKVDSDAETEKLQATFRTALTQRQPVVPPNITRLLQQHASRDVEELLPHLEARGELVGKEARKKLSQRATKEAEAMKKILEGQKKRIETESDRFANVLFQFKDEEKKQMEADQRHWNKRLAAIDQEIADEPGRIKKLYTVEAERLEPVGLVYLWPHSG
ncbi:MAG: helicase-related protein [Gemmatales bacterium]